MAKHKSFISNLLIMIFVLGFVSCGNDNDNKPETTVYDQENLIGEYVGSCTVILGSKSEVVESFYAEFRRKDSQTLSLNIGNVESGKSVGIYTTKTASGFISHGSYAEFSLEGINDQFGTNQIPSFIKNNINPGWDIIDMTLELNIDSNNSPKYIIASKNLKFTYTGVVKVTGANSTDNSSGTITYIFDLNKQ